MNLGGPQTDGVASVLQDEDDDAVDPHLELIKNETAGDESDEEDEDFVADVDDGGWPTDDSGDGESDASDGGEEKELPVRKNSKKELSSVKASSSRKETKDSDDGSKKKKKDPNAPKRAISVFIFFSQTEREALHDEIKLFPINLENKPAWYKEKVYPENKVPPLEHNGKVIGESLDLVKYLDSNFKGAALLPDDPAKQKFAEELIAYSDSLIKNVFTSFRGDPVKEAGNKQELMLASQQNVILKNTLR